MVFLCCSANHLLLVGQILQALTVCIHSISILENCEQQNAPGGNEAHESISEPMSGCISFIIWPQVDVMPSLAHLDPVEPVDSN